MRKKELFNQSISLKQNTVNFYDQSPKTQSNTGTAHLSKSTKGIIYNQKSKAKS